MSTLNGAIEEIARRSFIDFCKRVDSSFTTPPHIELLCDRLQALHEGRIQRLIVSMPPRHGKSRTCSQLFPAYALGREPKTEILIASHSESVAEEFSRKCMSVIESEAYPFSVKIAQDSRSVARFHITGGGSCRAVGLESRLLSFGASLLVVDDITNSNSASEQALAWKWWREIAYPRLNEGGKCLIVGARQPGDLIGKLLESESDYEYLALKALAEEGDVLGRPVGAALWPAKFNENALQKICASILDAFESQYQQRTGTETPLFSLSDCPSFTKLQRVEQPWNPLWLEYVSPLEYARPDDSADTVTIQSYDTAGTLNSKPERATNSYHAIVTLQVNLVTGIIAVTGSEKFRGNYRSLFEKSLFALAYYNPSIVLIEAADPIGGQLYAELRTRRNGVCAVRPKVSKRERMLEVVDLIRAGRVHIRESIRSDFDPQKKGNQDSIDALVQGLAVARDIRANRVNELSPISTPSIFG